MTKSTADDQFDDLKQFIDSRISQSEARMDKKFDELEDKLTTRMDDGFAAVGDAIDLIHTDIVDLDTRTDTRLTALEDAA